jgi:hypothetical protein
MKSRINIKRARIRREKQKGRKMGITKNKIRYGNKHVLSTR